MTDRQLIDRIQKEAKTTAEFILHEDATNELIHYLGKYLPREQLVEAGKLIETYGRTAAELGQQMMIIAEELEEE